MKDSYFDGAELDRIDNNGNYEINNCRWVTHKENSNNRKKYNNKTGYTGVYFKPKINKYVSYFYVNRNKYTSEVLIQQKGISSKRKSYSKLPIRMI